MARVAKTDNAVLKRIKQRQEREKGNIEQGKSEQGFLSYVKVKRLNLIILER